MPVYSLFCKAAIQLLCQFFLLPLNTDVLEGPSLHGLLCSRGSREHLSLNLTHDPYYGNCIIERHHSYGNPAPHSHSALLQTQTQPPPSLCTSAKFRPRSPARSPRFKPLIFLDFLSSWLPTSSPVGINSPIIAQICPHSHSSSHNHPQSYCKSLQIGLPAHSTSLTPTDLPKTLSFRYWSFFHFENL